MSAYRAIRCRLDPTPQQFVQLTGIVGACRYLWNAALEHRELIWRMRAITVRSVQQDLELPSCKTVAPWLAKAPHHALQQTLRDLDRAYANYFAGRAKHPRFKAKRQQGGFRVSTYGKDYRILPTGRHVRMTKVTGPIRARLSQLLEGEPKSASVTFDGEHWWLAIMCLVPTLDVTTSTSLAVGLDLGIAHTITLSTGETLNVPCPTLNDYRRLRLLQRRVSRRSRGSVGACTTWRAVARWHHRWANIRRDWIAKTTRRLTSDFGLIVIEDLNIQGMTTRRIGRGRAAKAALNRALLTRSFSALRVALERRALGRVVAVPAAYTSQTCYKCRFVAAENRESQAIFRCRSCGHEVNADVNAAQNILRAGQARSAGGAERQQGAALNPEPWASSTEPSPVAVVV